MRSASIFLTEKLRICTAIARMLLTAIIVAASAELNEIGIVILFAVDVVVDKIAPPWL